MDAVARCDCCRRLNNYNLLPMQSETSKSVWRQRLTPTHSACKPLVDNQSVLVWLAKHANSVARHERRQDAVGRERWILYVRRQRCIVFHFLQQTQKDSTFFSTDERAQILDSIEYKATVKAFESKSAAGTIYPRTRVEKVEKSCLHIVSKP
jgi:hypothetical protein